MNQEHEEEYVSENASADDVTPKANLIIWGNFFVFVIALLVFISALTFYFRDAVESEQMIRVGEAKSVELTELRGFEQSVLSGQTGVLPGKKHISIDEAMNRLVQIVGK